MSRRAPELLDEIYARAEGNPFFAEELLALGADDQLPSTVRDLLLARLESLPPATRQVLRTACLVGREVPSRLLEAVVDVRDERLEAALREAVEAHVLQPDGDALVFRHALLQEAIAASLLPGEAARTHRRLAETLTESPDLAGRRYGGVAGRLARHWDAAGEPGQALVASVAAGREASNALAFAESLAHYQRALELEPGRTGRRAVARCATGPAAALDRGGRTSGRPPGPGHRADQGGHRLRRRRTTSTCVDGCTSGWAATSGCPAMARARCSPTSRP